MCEEESRGVDYLRFFVCRCQKRKKRQEQQHQQQISKSVGCRNGNQWRNAGWRCYIVVVVVRSLSTRATLSNRMTTSCVAMNSRVPVHVVVAEFQRQQNKFYEKKNFSRNVWSWFWDLCMERTANMQIALRKVATNIRFCNIVESNLRVAYTCQCELCALLDTHSLFTHSPI